MLFPILENFSFNFFGILLDFPHFPKSVIYTSEVFCVFQPLECLLHHGKLSAELHYIFNGALNKYCGEDTLNIILLWFKRRSRSTLFRPWSSTPFAQHLSPTIDPRNTSLHVLGWYLLSLYINWTFSSVHLSWITSVNYFPNRWPSGE